MRADTPLTALHLGNWHIQVRIVPEDNDRPCIDLPTFMVYALGIREALSKAMDVLLISVPGPLPDPLADTGTIEAFNPDHWYSLFHITATYKAPWTTYLAWDPNPNGE